MDLLVEDGLLAVCRLPPGSAVPEWANRAHRFLTVSRTPEELSVTLDAEVVPPDAACARGYRALRVKGPLDFDLVGVLASIAGPLAEAGISIFNISTHDTDYVLVKSADLARAVAALETAGHRVQGFDPGE
ncbi:MAG TPA: ACT domain-containing protein [Gemmatimonadales bacterium]|nr:ACT domain-containing protein [Gemmatimonadales bacterium]